MRDIKKANAILNELMQMRDVKFRANRKKTIKTKFGKNFPQV